MRGILSTLLAAAALTMPAAAHRETGLLQKSLVEVTDREVLVQVTVHPGMDVAKRVIALMDANGDGNIGTAEADIWAARFMEVQSVTMDGRPLPLRLEGVSSTPPSDILGGHPAADVRFSADLGTVKPGAHAMVFRNGWEPFAGEWQCDGLVSGTPAVRITSHSRDEVERELKLCAEFRGSALGVPAAAVPKAKILPAPYVWVLGIAAAAAMLGVLKFRMTSRRSTGFPRTP